MKMTESESSKKLRAYLKCKEREVKGIYEDCNNKRCDDCDLCYMQGTTGEHMTAIGIAIQALEKQIPKKVRYEDVGYEQYGNVNVYACICPSCDLEIIKFNDNDVSEKCESNDVEKMFHSSMVHHAYIGLNNYCNRCGQKLDWSDEK